MTFKIYKYYIDYEIDEEKCDCCGSKILVDQVSYELVYNKLDIGTLCGNCKPKTKKIIRGTQLKYGNKKRK